MKYPNINDNELVYLVRENNEEAKDFLYQKYSRIVRSIASRYSCYIKEVGLEFEDLIQEGYLGLYHAVSYYNQDREAIFYTFATICIERQIQNYLRNRNSMKHYPLNHACSYDEEIEHALCHKSLSLEQEKDKNLDLFFQHLYFFSWNLSWEERGIFLLYLEGFPTFEIATLLGYSKKQIYSKLSRAKKYIREYFPNSYLSI